MSGKPNIEQINELREQVSQFAKVRAQIIQCERVIEDNKRAMKAAIEVAEESKKNISRLMEEMDVASRGNFGYENRFMVFISELLFPASNPS